MKRKTFIALVIAAVTAGSAQALVIHGEKDKEGTVIDINGRIAFELSNSTNNRTDLFDRGSRVRIDAIHSFTDKWGVLAAAEMRFSTGTETFNDLHIKRAYGGIFHKDIGELTFGRQLTHGDNLGTADYDYEMGSILQVTAEHNKAIKFSSVEFNGFKIGADYYFGNRSKSTTSTTSTTTYTIGGCTDPADVTTCTVTPITTTNSITHKSANTDSGFDVVGYYNNKFGDITLNAEVGFGQITKSTDGSKANEYKIKSHGAGASLSYAGATLGFDYSHAETSKRGEAYRQKGFYHGVGVKNDDVDQYQVAFKYNLTPQNTFHTAYIWGVGETQGDNEKDKLRGWIAGIDHKFNENFLLYVEGGLFKVKEADKKIGEDKVIALGTRILF